jgi:hypothetical protein
MATSRLASSCRRPSICVHVLHVLLVERRALDEVLGAQLLVRQRAAADVAKLGAHEAAQVAGGDVLQLEDAKEVIVDLDQHALAHAGRLNAAHGARSGEGPPAETEAIRLACPGRRV